jgi:hypothetical protein
MTALATMLALLPLAVIGGSGGIGGAFISAPLAIVVIGGLFTSTVLTLVLVPVLYSLASRFTGPRTTRDLDAVLDAAEDRRFKPLGMRTAAQAQAAAVAVAAAPAVAEEYVVHVIVEPEPGTVGDPKVLESLRQQGFGVEPVDGGAGMRISIRRLSASSSKEATEQGLKAVRKSVPERGYRLTAPEAMLEER